MGTGATGQRKPVPAGRFQKPEPEPALPVHHGAGDSLHAWVVAPVLADIQQRGLPWLFALENLRNSEIPLKLQNMDVDFGIVRTSALAAEGLESRAICSMDYALYVPAALAGKKVRGREEDFHACWACSPWLRWGAVPASMPR